LQDAFKDVCDKKGGEGGKGGRGKERGQRIAILEKRRGRVKKKNRKSKDYNYVVIGCRTFTIRPFNLIIGK